MWPFKLSYEMFIINANYLLDQLAQEFISDSKRWKLEKKLEKLYKKNHKSIAKLIYKRGYRV